MRKAKSVLQKSGRAAMMRTSIQTKATLHSQGAATCKGALADCLLPFNTIYFFLRETHVGVGTGGGAGAEAAAKRQHRAARVAWLLINIHRLDLWHHAALQPIGMAICEASRAAAADATVVLQVRHQAIGGLRAAAVRGGAGDGEAHHRGVIGGGGGVGGAAAARCRHGGCGAARCDQVRGRPHVRLVQLPGEHKSVSEILRRKQQNY